MARVGDVNGDGTDDVIIGARFADPNGNSAAGESYIVFGRDTATVGDFPASIELSLLDGANGFAMTGISENDFSGHSVSAAGDVNGDGVDDVIVGAHFADISGNVLAGQCYVVFGKNTATFGDFQASLDLSLLDGFNGYRIDGVSARDYCGVSVSAAGDVNGDGMDDLIVGAYKADPNGMSAAGACYVIFERPPGPDCPADTNGDCLTNVFDFTALLASFGTGPGATRAQGDITGDGFVDIFDFTTLTDDFGCRR